MKVWQEARPDLKGYKFRITKKSDVSHGLEVLIRATAVCWDKSYIADM